MRMIVGSDHWPLVLPASTHFLSGRSISCTSIWVIPRECKGARSSVTVSCRSRSARAA